MLANMANALIEHKRITTTVAKAKALRKYIEPLITRAKDNTTHSRRVVFSYLKNKHSIKELFDEIALKVADRPGGYTRILRTGFRAGDNADMCIIELVDYNETYQRERKATRKKRTRRGGVRKPADTPAAPVEEAVTTTEEKAPAEPETEAAAPEDTASPAAEPEEKEEEQPSEEAPVEEQPADETAPATEEETGEAPAEKTAPAVEEETSKAPAEDKETPADTAEEEKQTGDDQPEAEEKEEDNPDNKEN